MMMLMMIKVNLSHTSITILYFQGVRKSDNYAFLQMEDESAYENITKDAVRIFGILIKVLSI